MQKLEPKRGNIFIYIALLVVAIFAMVYAYNRSHRAPEPPKPVELEQDTLRVGIQISPLGVSTASDTLGGFYYDMIRQLASDNGLAITTDGFTQISAALEKLDRNDYDLVISDIPVTQNLREEFLFTNPIYADREVLVQRRDSILGQPPISTQSGLRGATVHISAQSPFITRLQNLSREIGDTIYIIQDREYGPEQLMVMTSIGEIDNVVVNEHVAKAIARDYPNLDISLSLSFNQFQSWAVAKRDSVLLDSLNIYIDRFKDTPAFRSLIDRYFNERQKL